MGVLIRVLLLFLLCVSSLIGVYSDVYSLDEEDWIQLMHPGYAHTFDVDEDWHPINQVLWFPALNQVAIFNKTIYPYQNISITLGSDSYWWDYFFTHYLTAGAVHTTNLTAGVINADYVNVTNGTFNYLEVDRLNASFIHGVNTTVSVFNITNNLSVENIILGPSDVINITSWNEKGVLGGCLPSFALQNITSDGVVCVSVSGMDIGEDFAGFIPYWNTPDSLVPSYLYVNNSGLFIQSSFLPASTELYDLGSSQDWWYRLFVDIINAEEVYLGDLHLNESFLRDLIPSDYCGEGMAVQNITPQGFECVDILTEEHFQFVRGPLFVEFPSSVMRIQNGTDFTFRFSAVDFANNPITYSAEIEGASGSLSNNFVTFSAPSALGEEILVTLTAESSHGKDTVQALFRTYDFEYDASLFLCEGTYPAFSHRGAGWDSIQGEWTYTDAQDLGACEFTCLDGYTFDSLTNTCYIEINQYTLSVTFSGEGSGYASLMGASDDVCFESCELFFDDGSFVNVFVTSNPGSSFVSFGGDCEGDACDLVMNENKSIDINLELDSYTVSFNSNEGSFEEYEDEVYTRYVSHGSIVGDAPKVSREHFNFRGWYDDSGSLFNSGQVITHDRSYTANWDEKQYVASCGAVHRGTVASLETFSEIRCSDGSVEGFNEDSSGWSWECVDGLASDSCVVCREGFFYDEDSKSCLEQLSAECGSAQGEYGAYDDSYRVPFCNVGNVVDSDNNPVSDPELLVPGASVSWYCGGEGLIMSRCEANRTMVFNLSVIKKGDGLVVFSHESLPEIDCGDSCKGQYPEGELIDLTVISQTGYSYTIDGCDEIITSDDGNTECILTMNSNREVYVSFQPLNSPNLLDPYIDEGTTYLNYFKGNIVVRSDFGSDYPNIDSCFARINDGEWIDASIDASGCFLLYTDRQNLKIRFKAVADNGMEGFSSVSDFTYDATPPVTAISGKTQNDNSYTFAVSTEAQSINVSLECSDAGVGCNQTYYCTGESCEPSQIYTGEIRITDQGLTTIRYYSVDHLGNIEETHSQSIIFCNSGYYWDQDASSCIPGENILTVVKFGSGTGRVHGGVIDCGSDCMGAFGQNENINLQITPDHGTYISNVDGCDTRSNDNCLITMSSNRVLAVTFALCPYSFETSSLPVRYFNVKGAVSVDRLCFGPGRCITSFDLLHNSMNTFTLSASERTFNFGTLNLNSVCLSGQCISSLNIMGGSESPGCVSNSFADVSNYVGNMFVVQGSVNAERLCIGETCIDSWEILSD